MYNQLLFDGRPSLFDLQNILAQRSGEQEQSGYAAMLAKFG
jgi:hypothetical protein